MFFLRYVNKNYLNLLIEQWPNPGLVSLSACNNTKYVKAALHQLDINLGGFISALQYLDGEIMCRISDS